MWILKERYFFGKQNNKYETLRQVLIGELEKQQGSHVSGVEGVRGREVENNVRKWCACVLCHMLQVTVGTLLFTLDKIVSH